MANLVELSNELEFVPKEQLIQMSQDPNSTYPSYLVLSEIQRRTQMEKMYAAQQPKPETTVSDELVAEFAGSPSGLGAMAQSSDIPNAFQSGEMGNMAPPSPLMTAASGGLTGYKNKGKTEYKEAADDYGKQLQEIFEKQKRYRLNKNNNFSFLPDNYIVSDEEYNRLKRQKAYMKEGGLDNLQDYRPFFALMGALSGEKGPRYMPESKVKGLQAKLKASIIEDKLSQMGMETGGLTGYQAGGMTEQEMLKNQFLQSAGIGNDNPMQEQLNKEEVDRNFGQLAQQYGVSGLKAIGALNEDGSINYVNSALAIASINPAFRLAKGAVGLGGRFVNRFAPGLLQGAKNLVTKPGMKIQNPALKKGMQYGDDIIDPKTGAKIPKVITGPRTLKMPTVRGIGSLALPSLLVGNLIEGGRERQDERELQAKLKAEQEKEAAKQLEENIAARQEAAREKEAERIAQAKKSRNADMLIGLGGAIGSARNLGELSSGISDAYFGVKSSEQASEFKGLQGRLLEAQIANLAPKSIIDEQNSIIAYLELAQEGAVTLTDEQKKQLNDKLLKLQEQLELMRSKTGTGFAASESPTGGNMGILEKTKIPA